MRLTIKRMRTLVLVAGVLLLAALVAFLVAGKWRSSFLRRDLPQRLGMEIQQEANGVTYTQERGGHTLFKIHASRVVQLKKGNAQLHDVWIDLYSADGKSVDRIAGSEFEYDQKAGTATAAGAVEITLMRPGATPAVATTLAPKAAAQAATGKSTPLSSAAKAATRGEMHVETSGLTFDQKSGIATTSQPVRFSLPQGSGSSTGATFDSDQGLLVLDRDVRLSTARGAATLRIQARHAEFERDSQTCQLRAATADYQGGQASAGAAKILFRADGSAVQLNATDGFTLTTASGSRLTAPSGQLEFDAHNRPREGRLEGGVTMESATDNGGLRRLLHGSALTADLAFNAQGQLRHAHLERGVTMDSEEWSGAGAHALHLLRHWSSPVADVDFRVSGSGQIAPETAQGSGGVVVTSESRRGSAAVTTSRFSADQVTGVFATGVPAGARSGAHSGAELTALHGLGHARIEETTAAGERQTTSGDRLDVHFQAANTAHGARRGESPEDQIQSATVAGNVVLTEQAPARSGAPAPAPLRATAGRADYAGAGQWLHLTVSPRIEDGALELTADKVDVSEVSGDAFAHGDMKASWMQAGTGSGRAQPAAAGGVELGGQGPAHVVANEAELSRATGEATFRGRARLWQQANSISAPVIVLDRDRQTLHGSTRSVSAPVLLVLVNAGGTGVGAGMGSRAGQPAKESGQITVISVRGGDLLYSGRTRTAVIHGGVLGTVVAATEMATSTAQEVQVILPPAGKTSGASPIESLTARGRVVLTSDGRRASGEQLVYTGATGEYVLTGTASAPPRLSDPARGTVTGAALIFHAGDDSIRVEGGGEKTRTETIAPGSRPH